MDSSNDTGSVLDKPAGNRPIKRNLGRNFLPEDSIPNEQTAPAETPAAPAPKKTAPANVKTTKRKKEPAPVRVPWATRMRPELIKNLDDYMTTLPRHVTLQDVVEYIVTDFLKRKPDLPDALIHPPASR